MLKPWRGNSAAGTAAEAGAAAAAAVRSAAAAADATGTSVVCESKLLKLKEVCDTPELSSQC